MSKTPTINKGPDEFPGIEQQSQQTDRKKGFVLIKKTQAAVKKLINHVIWKDMDEFHSNDSLGG